LTGVGFQPYGRTSWWDIAESYYDNSAEDALHRSSIQVRNIKVRIVYGSATQQIPIRLVANDKY
jgi:hypothetical protein